ncbi:MAG: helicase [Planctomycetes bacterium]|nr:helicase [Planctomycetota bacterium]
MTPGATSTSSEVRARLVEAMRLDLVGPDASLPTDAQLLAEVLPEAPSQWYLTGFLAPFEGPTRARADDEPPESMDAGGDEGARDDAAELERPVARRAFFASSMGLSFLAPAACTQIRATVEWGDYSPEARDGAPPVWRRRARHEEIPLPLDGGPAVPPVSVPSSDGLELVVVSRATSWPAGVPGAPAPGTRAVTVFLVNRRAAPPEDAPRDTAFVFQAKLRLRAEVPFIARPDPLALAAALDPDLAIAALQFSDAVEYAVGHNVSARWALEGERCTEVATDWLPATFVDRVESRDDLRNVTLDMEALSRATDAATIREGASPLVLLYSAWIDEHARASAQAESHRNARLQLVEDARRAARRMEEGIDSLSDPKVFEAFRIANRAVARAIRQRAAQERPDRDPERVDAPAWRPFQLAFFLLNVRGLADPDHPDRRVVDLLFFPTGGGKTEAYLGLAAFSIALRRLRDPSPRSSGVTVLMRYTLRLLTLDQFGRAATLVCALELERQRRPTELGTWPIEIGLWVGMSATPNRLGGRGDDGKTTARAKVQAYKREPKARPSPIPLETCPWCGTKFEPWSFDLQPNDDVPDQLRIYCASRTCEFTPNRQRFGLPVQAVDEPIYRRLPAFLIATLDKFAALPWEARAGALLGRVDRHDPDGFYGAAEPGKGTPLGGYLPPPALVIQDELHLVSGPLGTMAGLYETAIEALCGRAAETGPALCPKVVASTATVKRAQAQIRALFARSEVAIFPPPGPDRRDTFFSKAHVGPGAGGRLYLGVAAQGRNLKVVLLRAYLALLAAARRSYDDARRAKRDPNPADPYMTLVGYFNSLRELGGSRRIIEDEVASRLNDYGQRRRRVEPTEPVLFADRRRFHLPRELTSREPTHRVADTKRCLALDYEHESEHVDVALATNMISVGLDITRLGLMVVTGQPKSAAEYIQATSRVGREKRRPGLVVTLLNVNRARDRSHYERFSAWHESFYRAVEATSVTPFSPRAVDRGLASVVVALARHGRPELTEARGAERVLAHRHELGFVADALAARGIAHAPLSEADAQALAADLRTRAADLLDAWASIAQDKGQLQYQREVGHAPPLLRDPLDPELDRLLARERKFRSHRSLRDVEPSVLLRMAGLGEDAS